MAMAERVSGEQIAVLRETLRSHPEDRQATGELARALLAAGHEAARAGSREVAKETLEEALALDPDAEEGWLWLAGVQKERQAQKRCLQRLLEINPAHPHARALLQRAEFRDEPQRTQPRCPVCGAARPADGFRCPGCRCLLTLDDLPALLDNAEVDAGAVQQAIRTRQGLASWGGGVELHLALALAHLNLGQIEPGLHHLQALSARRPSDAGLKAQIEALVRRHRPGKETSATTAPHDEPKPGETEAAAGAVSSAALPTLLAIDDSATVRKLVAASLVDHGVRVLTAGSADEGLSKLREHRIGLVLLDADLPGGGGYEVCRTIKSDSSTAHVPVILMSGRDGLLERRRARKAGGSGHLSKPFESRTLLDLARKTFEEPRKGGSP